MEHPPKPPITETGVQRFFESDGKETPKERQDRQERCRTIMAFFRAKYRQKSMHTDDVHSR